MAMAYFYTAKGEYPFRSTSVDAVGLVDLFDSEPWAKLIEIVRDAKDGGPNGPYGEWHMIDEDGNIWRREAQTEPRTLDRLRERFAA